MAIQISPQLFAGQHAVSQRVAGRPAFDKALNAESAPASELTKVPTDRAAPKRSGVVTATSFSSQQSSAFALQLTTLEGDAVAIRFTDSQAFSSSSYASTEKFSSVEEYSSSNQQLQIRVQGDLSAQEQAAVDSLLQSIEHVAENFFADHMEQAIAAVGTLDFDSNQLSSMSLNLSLQKTTEYVRVEQASGGGFGSVPDLPGGATATAGALRQMLEALADTQKQLIEHAKEQFDPVNASRLVRELLPALLVDAADRASRTPDKTA